MEQCARAPAFHGFRRPSGPPDSTRGYNPVAPAGLQNERARPTQVEQARSFLRPLRLCGASLYFNSTSDPTFGNAPTSGRAYSLNASLMSFPFTMYDSSKCFVSRATVASGVRNVSI